jgi:hypothetical protein
LAFAKLASAFFLDFSFAFVARFELVLKSCFAATSYRRFFLRDPTAKEH